MTSNKTDYVPPSARQLLHDHGLPEDVIDGALCLHAQELAAAIRTETDTLKARGVLEPDKYRPCRDAADQIDPTRSDDPAPSVPSAIDRAGLRDQTAETLREHYLCTNRDEADADGNMPCRCGDRREPGAEVDDENDWDAHLADAVLAVLPPPADRAAVLREAADRLDAQTCDCGCRRGAELLRYMADEAAVVPPPALTEEGRLRAHVEVLQQDAERDRGLAKVGARCMREGHQGLIENGRVVIEGWRFALSTALDLGTDAPWEAIHERAKELRRVADEAQPARLDRCPHGCDTSTCPCLACEADDEQPSGGPCVAGEQQNETPKAEAPRRSRTARFLDALTHSGPGYDLTPPPAPSASASPTSP